MALVTMEREVQLKLSSRALDLACSILRLEGLMVWIRMLLLCVHKWLAKVHHAVFTMASHHVHPGPLQRQKNKTNKKKLSCSTVSFLFIVIYINCVISTKLTQLFPLLSTGRQFEKLLPIMLPILCLTSTYIYWEEGRNYFFPQQIGWHNFVQGTAEVNHGQMINNYGETFQVGSQQAAGWLPELAFQLVFFWEQPQPWICRLGHHTDTALEV